MSSKNYHDYVEDFFKLSAYIISKFCIENNTTVDRLTIDYPLCYFSVLVWYHTIQEICYMTNEKGLFYIKIMELLSNDSAVEFIDLEDYKKLIVISNNIFTSDRTPQTLSKLTFDKVNKFASVIDELIEGKKRIK